MKYITSILPYEFECAGEMIPKNKYTSEELGYGKRLILSISDAKYDEMMENKIFASLIQTKHLRVTDEIDAEKVTASDEVSKIKAEKDTILKNAALNMGKLDAANKALQDRVGYLEAENTQLQTALQDAQAELDKIKAKKAAAKAAISQPALPEAGGAK